jgi:hypothetical protein
MDSVTTRVALQMRLMCPEYEAWDKFNRFSTPHHGPLLGKPFSARQKVTVAEIQGGEAARIDPTVNRSPRYDMYTTNEVCPELLKWYLLFLMLSIHGSDGVAIQLFHGAAVGWDGRRVRHCTTVPADRNGTRLVDLRAATDEDEGAVAVAAAIEPRCTSFSVVARAAERTTRANQLEILFAAGDLKGVLLLLHLTRRHHHGQ